MMQRHAAAPSRRDEEGLTSGSKSYLRPNCNAHQSIMDGNKREEKLVDGEKGNLGHTFD